MNKFFDIDKLSRPKSDATVHIGQQLTTVTALLEFKGYRF